MTTAEPNTELSLAQNERYSDTYYYRLTAQSIKNLYGTKKRSV